MGTFKDEVKSSFHRVVSFIKDSNLFSSDTFSKDQVKAGLYKFSEDTNWLLEGHDPAIREERNQFFKSIDLNDHVGQDEIYAILEKHEILMRKKFPNTYPSRNNHNIGDAAFNKAKYITENIKKMTEVSIDDYSHKFDRMIGAYEKPFLAVDNEKNPPTHG